MAAAARRQARRRSRICASKRRVTGPGRRLDSGRVGQRRPDPRRQGLAQFHAPLVEGIDALQHALHEGGVLISASNMPSECG